MGWHIVVVCCLLAFLYFIPFFNELELHGLDDIYNALSSIKHAKVLQNQLNRCNDDITMYQKEISKLQEELTSLRPVYTYLWPVYEYPLWWMSGATVIISIIFIGLYKYVKRRNFMELNLHQQVGNLSRMYDGEKAYSIREQVNLENRLRKQKVELDLAIKKQEEFKKISQQRQNQSLRSSNEVAHDLEVSLANEKKLKEEIKEKNGELDLMERKIEKFLDERQ